MSKGLKMSELKDGMTVTVEWSDSGKSCQAIVRWYEETWFLCQDMRNGMTLPTDQKAGKRYSWALTPLPNGDPPLVKLTRIVRTIDELATGDTIVDFDRGTEYYVEQVSPSVFVLIKEKGYPSEESAGLLYTISELKRYGYKLKVTDEEEEEEVVEMTLEEVAKLKGVPVERLRIKDK